MNSGYFYCPYIDLGDDPASAEEKPQEDFPYEVGEYVWVEGGSEQSIGFPAWRAKIIKRWYEEDMEKIHKYSPYWFAVEAVDDPPEFRHKGRGWPIIVGEEEIRRFK